MKSLLGSRTLLGANGNGINDETIDDVAPIHTLHRRTYSLSGLRYYCSSLRFEKAEGPAESTTKNKVHDGAVETFLRNGLLNID